VGDVSFQKIMEIYKISFVVRRLESNLKDPNFNRFKIRLSIAYELKKLGW
jgi:hypothetical protein